MDFLKKVWPHPFKLIAPKAVKPFVILLIIYAVIPTVFSTVGGVVVMVSPDVIGALVGGIIALVGSLIGIYTSGGIVMSILKFAGVFDRKAEEDKDEGNDNN